MLLYIWFSLAGSCDGHIKCTWWKPRWSKWLESFQDGGGRLDLLLQVCRKTLQYPLPFLSLLPRSRTAINKRVHMLPKTDPWLNSRQTSDVPSTKPCAVNGEMCVQRTEPRFQLHSPPGRHHLLTGEVFQTIFIVKTRAMRNMATLQTQHAHLFPWK